MRRPVGGGLHPSWSIKRLMSKTIYNSRTGFTLIEIIIIMFIIGLSAGLVTIFVGRDTSNRDLNTFVKDSAVILRYARNHAITEKIKYSFVVSGDQGFYGLYIDRKPDGDVGEAGPVIKKPLPETLDIYFKGSSSDAVIDFYPQGSSSGGSIRVVSRKGKEMFLIINRVTGSVKIAKTLN